LSDVGAGLILQRMTSDSTASVTGAAGGVEWDASDYHHHSSAQTAWGREVHERLALRGDEHVVDLGSGDGRLTSELGSRLPRGSVTGIDVDAHMVDFAQRHYAGGNVSFVRADVSAFALGRSVDLFVSTACLHWVEDDEKLLRCCRRHLERGGRLVFQMGGRGNCAELLATAKAIAREPRWAQWLEPFDVPWYFRAPEDYAAVLPRSGFRIQRAELVPKQMLRDSADDLGAWLRTTWMPVMARVPEARRSELVATLVERHLEHHPPDAQGRTSTAMVRLEVEAEAI
jgi:trans-aconitate 2-methyltransferase